MVKGIVNAFDDMGFCLVLNLTTACTDGKRAVIWPPKFAIKYVSFATNFYWVASNRYQLKSLFLTLLVL